MDFFNVFEKRPRLVNKPSRPLSPHPDKKLVFIETLFEFYLIFI